MTKQASGRIDVFREKFSGKALIPGDSGYDAARSVWNGAIDRRPALIACCMSASDVADAIRFARDNGFEIAVRGGGHNYAGHAVCDGGVMIHLGGMNAVRVDPAARRAVCGGGTTWGDIDAATQQHALATTGGFISHTGIAGLTLGGGIGWLTKQAGLACDNLVAAEMVLADSRIIRVSDDENPELMWALRGGGGNFGIVTSFEYALQPVGPTVNLALLFWELERGSDALRLARDTIHELPHDTTAFLAVALSAPPAPFVPEADRLRVGHALLIAGFGSAEAHAALVAPVRKALPPLFELLTPMPYIALQQMFNDSAPWGLRGYEKALYLNDLSDGVIATISEHAPKKQFPLSFCPTFALDGTYRAVADDATAFGGSRSAGFMFNIAGHATTPEVYAAEREWVRNFWDAMRPHAAGSGSYVNFMTEMDEERVRATYGAAKYARLARIKATYDPDNVFQRNANIKPAVSA